jgi:hypothetical protein
MAKSHGIRAAAVLSLLALTAACGQQTGTGSGKTGGGSHIGSIAADVAVLRVDYVGGFVAPVTLATRLPIVSIYGDGRVISEGPQTLIYPGPALPNVLIRHIKATDVDKMVSRALAAGVGSKLDLGTPQVADAPSTRFTVVTEEGTKTVQALALNGDNDQKSGLTQRQRAARTALWNLLSALTNLPGTLGAGAVSKEESYQATAVAAIAVPWAAGSDTQITRPEIPWPGPALPGPSLAAATNLGCVDASGETATKIFGSAGKASTITPWISGGSRWTVSVRPLLPGESGCADLRKTD